MNICLLGAGKMGSWLAEELEKKHSIAFFDPSPSAGQSIKDVARLEAPAGILEFGPDVLINAASLRQTVEAFRAVEQFLPEDCLLCDVASIKGDLPEYYRSGHRRYVSIHPMFGPTFARMDNVAGENAVIIRESDPAGKAFWTTFFAERGVRVFEYSMEEHDEMMAYSLTLPFVSSLVFSSCVTMSAVPGTTFRKHLEVAKGLLGEDDYLLTEILFNPESLAQLERISARLNHLWHIVKQRDDEEAGKFIGSLRKNLVPAVSPPAKQ